MIVFKWPVGNLEVLFYIWIIEFIHMFSFVYICSFGSLANVLSSYHWIELIGIVKIGLLDH